MIKYNLTTYSLFSHNFLIGVLSSNSVQYTYEILESEQSYSKFAVLSDTQTFEKMKDIMESNNGTSITIEYGTY